MNGMNESIQRRILALEPHLTILKNQSKNPLQMEKMPIVEKLKSFESARVSLFENQDVILRTIDGQFRGAVARGTSRDSLIQLIQHLNSLDRDNKNVSRDVVYWDPKEIPEQSEIVIGLDLARSLRVLEGDFITIIPPEGLILPPGEAPPFERVRVRKIITTSLSDVDAQYVFYVRGLTLRNFSKTASRHIGLEIWLPNGNNANRVKKWLKEEIPSDILSYLTVETWMDRNASLFYALRLEKLIIGIFLGLAGLIASSSILTVLALLMSQKKRDIALLRALGMSARETVNTFTRMGILLAGISILVGLLIGTLVGWYVQENPINILPEIYYDSKIPAKVDFLLILGVLIFGALVSFLGAWIPARTALEIEPSEALRQKN